MPDLFASAKRSLGRGQYHIGDLAQRLNAINASKTYASFAVELQPDGATEILKVKFHPLFRDEFPSIVFDAVSNFRACLDQMTYAMAVPGGLPDEDFAYFPICSDIKFIDDRINGLKYLPPEIRTLFRSFNPYKGGNDTLWALNELCNVKKHAALIPIDLRGLQIGLHGRDVSVIAGMQVRKLHFEGPISLGGSAFDAEKNEIAIGTFPKGSSPDTQTKVSFAVVLKHPEKVISGQHPIFLLDQIRTEVDRILADTEAECRRLGIIT